MNMRCFVSDIGDLTVSTISTHWWQYQNWFIGSCSCSKVKKTGIWRHITEDMWRNVLCYQSPWRHFSDVWRHVFYNTTCRHSQKTCDVVHSTRHDVISEDMWRHAFSPDYMTSPLGRRDAVYSTRHDVISWDMWHVFDVRIHDVTIQWTYDAVYFTTHRVTVKKICDVTCSTPDYMTSLHRRRVTSRILPGMTSHPRTCDIMCSTPNYMTSLHRRRVTSRILPGMTSHRRTCDIMCSTPNYMTSLHSGHDVTSEGTVLFTVNAFLPSNLNFSSSVYVLVLNLLRFLMLIMFAKHSRKLILHVHIIHMNKIKLNLVVI